MTLKQSSSKMNVFCILLTIFMHEVISLACTNEQTVCTATTKQATIGQEIESVCNTWLGHVTNGTLAVFTSSSPWGVKCPCDQKFCPLNMQCIDASTSCNTTRTFEMTSSTATPWGVNCSAGSYFCPLYRTCIPSSEKCSLAAVDAWLLASNTSVDLFGNICPENETFCLGLMKCHNSSISCTLTSIVDMHMQNGSICNSTTEFYCSSMRMCLPVNSTCSPYAMIGNLSGVETSTGWHFLCSNYDHIAPLLLLGKSNCNSVGSTACSPVCGRNPLENCVCSSGDYYCSVKCGCISNSTACDTSAAGSVCSSYVSPSTAAGSSYSMYNSTMASVSASDILSTMSSASESLSTISPSASLSTVVAVSSSIVDSSVVSNSASSGAASVSSTAVHSSVVSSSASSWMSAILSSASVSCWSTCAAGFYYCDATSSCVADGFECKSTGPYCPQGESYCSGSCHAGLCSASSTTSHSYVMDPAASVPSTDMMSSSTMTSSGYMYSNSGDTTSILTSSTTGYNSAISSSHDASSSMATSMHSSMMTTSNVMTTVVASSTTMMASSSSSAYMSSDSMISSSVSISTVLPGSVDSSSHMAPGSLSSSYAASSSISASITGSGTMLTSVVAATPISSSMVNSSSMVTSSVASNSMSSILMDSSSMASSSMPSISTTSSAMSSSLSSVAASSAGSSSMPSLSSSHMTVSSAVSSPTASTSVLFSSSASSAMAQSPMSTYSVSSSSVSASSMSSMGSSSMPSSYMSSSSMATSYMPTSSMAANSMSSSSSANTVSSSLMTMNSMSSMGSSSMAASLMSSSSASMISMSTSSVISTMSPSSAISSMSTSSAMNTMSPSSAISSMSTSSAMSSMSPSSAMSSMSTSSTMSTMSPSSAMSSMSTSLAMSSMSPSSAMSSMSASSVVGSMSASSTISSMSPTSAMSSMSASSAMNSVSISSMFSSSAMSSMPHSSTVMSFGASSSMAIASVSTSSILVSSSPSRSMAVSSVSPSAITSSLMGLSSVSSSSVASSFMGTTSVVSSSASLSSMSSNSMTVSSMATSYLPSSFIVSSSVMSSSVGASFVSASSAMSSSVAVSSISSSSAMSSSVISSSMSTSLTTSALTSSMVSSSMMTTSMAPSSTLSTNVVSTSMSSSPMDSSSVAVSPMAYSSMSPSSMASSPMASSSMATSSSIASSISSSVAAPESSSFASTLATSSMVSSSMISSSIHVSSVASTSVSSMLSSAMVSSSSPVSSSLISSMSTILNVVTTSSSVSSSVADSSMVSSSMVSSAVASSSVASSSPMVSSSSASMSSLSSSVIGGSFGSSSLIHSTSSMARSVTSSPIGSSVSISSSYSSAMVSMLGTSSMATTISSAATSTPVGISSLSASVMTSSSQLSVALSSSKSAVASSSLSVMASGTTMSSAMSVSSSHVVASSLSALHSSVSIMQSAISNVSMSHVSSSMSSMPSAASSSMSSARSMNVTVMSTQATQSLSSSVPHSASISPSLMVSSVLPSSSSATVPQPSVGVSCSSLSPSKKNSAGGHVLSSLVNITSSAMLAVTGLFVQNCDGKLMVNSSSGWVDIPSDVNSTHAYLVMPSQLLRFQHGKCGCHGAVGLQYANVENGVMGGRADTTGRKICQIHLLAFPAGIPCVNNCKQLASLSLSMDEDASCTGFYFKDEVSVKTSVENATVLGSYASQFNSSLIAEYENAISTYVSKYAQIVRVAQLPTANGNWRGGMNPSVAADFTSGDLPISNYLCFRPSSNYHGNLSLSFQCGVKDGSTVVLHKTPTTFRIMVKPVKDKPEITQQSYYLPVLAFNFTDITGAGVNVSTVTSQTVTHVDGLSSGIAIQKSGSAVFGKWQYKCSSSWININVTNTLGNYVKDILLLKGTCMIRFSLTTDTWWRRSQASRDVSLVYRAWDMSDGLASGVHRLNVSSSSSLSENTGVIEQLRVGCNGAGTLGGKYDACGVCGGDNSTCLGCDMQPNSGAITDTCGNCTGGTTNKTFNFFMDCYKTCGEFFVDSCNKCVRRSTYTAPYRDCAGVCDGTAVNNTCGFCVGGNTSKPLDLGKDACGVCSGDNSSCADCAGVSNGQSAVDLCGSCLLRNASNRNQCVKLGAPSPSCGTVSGDLKLTIPAAGLSSFSSVSCSFILASSTTPATQSVLSANNESIIVTTPQLSSVGEYNISCTVGQQTIYITKNVLITNPASMNISGLEPNAVMVTSQTTTVHVIGSGFVNSTYLKCLVLTESISASPIVAPAQYINSTHVSCMVAGSEKSVISKISLDFCGNTVFNTGFSAQLSWQVNLPSVISTRFTTCSQVVIKFNGPVEATASPFLCSAILPSNHTALGSSSSCEVLNYDVVLNLLGSPSLSPGGKLVLKLSALKFAGAQATKYPSVIDVDLIAGTPVPAKIPSVEITAASVGSCDPYVVNIVNLKGGYLSYSWSVAGTGSLTAAQTAEVSNINSQISSKTKAKISVYGNSSLISVPLNFSATVRNCFGNSLTKVVTVTKENKEIPQLQIKKPKISTPVRRRVVVRTRTSLGCISTDNVNLKYTWELSPAVTGIITNRKTLVLPRNTLSAGKVYTATLTVSLLQQPDKFSAASAEISVVSLPLEAQISGQSIIGSAEVLRLKSKIVDPDNSDKQVSYSWTIFTASGNGVYLNGNPAVLDSTANININAKSLQLKAGTEYKVVLKISKDSRQQAAEHKFLVKMGSPPELIVDPIDGPLHPNEKNVISATLRSKSTGGTYLWTCEEVPGDAAYGCIDLSQRAVRVSGRYGTNEKKVYLIIKKKSLIGGIKYKFKLTGTDSDGVVSSSVISVKANQPPTKGLLTVSPANGTALQTTFTLSVPEGCVDSDGVSFIFGYVTSSGSTARAVLFTEQSGNELQTQLGVGLLDLSVSCFDPYGSFAYTSGVQVNVTAAPVSTQQVIAKQAELTRNMQEGNAEAVATLATQFLITVESSTASNAQETAEVTVFKKEATGSLVKELNSVQTASGKANLVNSLTLTTKGASSNFDTALVLNIVRALEKLNNPSSGSKRKRRAVSSTVTASTVAEVENQLTIFSNSLSPGKYDSNSMSAKSSFLNSLDNLAASLCKSYTVGEDRALAKADIAVLQVYVNDFSDVDTQYVPLGCPGNCSTCSNCPAYIKAADQILLGTSLKTAYSTGLTPGACVSSAQMPNDLLSSSANSSIMSNILRIRFWHPETSEALSVTTITSGSLVKIAATKATNKTYTCVRWDSGSSQWTTNDIMTMNPYGEQMNGVTHVSCNMTYLSYVALIEGPEIVTTAAPTTTQSPSTAAPTTRLPKNYKQKLGFKFTTACNKVFSASNKTAVEGKLLALVASKLGIPHSSMINYTISCGSVLNEWVQDYINGSLDVQAVASDVERRVQAGSLSVVLDGQTLPVDTASFSALVILPDGVTTAAPTTQATTQAVTTKPVEEGDSGLSGGAIAGIVIGVLIIVTVILVLLYVLFIMKKTRKNTAVEPNDNVLELRGKPNPGYHESP